MRKSTYGTRSMASILIRQAYTMPYEELKDGLDKLAGKLGERYQLDCDWESEECLCFSGAGANGKVAIGEEEIDLEVNLGILMSPFKGTIETEIRNFIAEFIY